MAAALLAAGLVVGVSVDRAAANHGGPVAVTEKMLRRVGIPVPQDEDLAGLVGTHWDTRARMLALQSAEVPHGAILLLGDSTIEGFWWNRLHVDGQDCAAINAGFAGAGVAELAERADAILAETRPRLVVVGVGINDAWPDADLAQWGRRYDALLAKLAAHGAAVVVLPILSPDPAFTRVTKSRETVAQMNALIRAAARLHGAVVADEGAAIAALSADHASLTVDGIHPTGAFYRALEARTLAPTIALVQEARHLRCVTTA